MPRVLEPVWAIVSEAISEWSANRAPRLAAALAYYTIFSIAPLLVLMISIAGLVFGREAVQGEIVGQIGGIVGQDGARAIEDLIASTDRPAASSVASLISLVILLFGAAGVVAELKDALNTMWEVPADTRSGLWHVVKKRFLSFALVLGIGFVLLVSLAISAGLAALSRYFTGLIPGSEAVLMVVTFVVSFAVIAGLFAALFKYLPDAQVRWSDVWIGAVVTAVLFEIGKFALGFYLGRGAVASAYGAAGSLVVVLIWVYYSAQIVFFGAEITRVYARRYGSGIVPEGQPQPQAPAHPVPA